MSIIIEFFAAPNHDAAAAVVDHGPDGVFASLVFGNFNAEAAMIEWESIFTGRSFEELVAADDPGVVAEAGGGDGPVVLAASGTLQGAFAAADQSRLVEVSELWVQERAAEGEVWDQETATRLLSDLAQFARSIGRREDRLYCWMA